MIYAFLYAHICPFVTLKMIMNLTCQLENINHINYYSGFVIHVEVLVAVRGGDLMSLIKTFQISVLVPVTMWHVPFVKSSRHTQGSHYRIASLLMRLNYIATAEGSRTNRLCNCTKFPM